MVSGRIRRAAREPPMTLLIFGIDDEHQWGDVFENNGTGTGTLGALYERRIEVGISAILLWYHVTFT